VRHVKAAPCGLVITGLPVVGAGGVDAVLVGDDLPELGADLVAALAGLQVDDLPHVAVVSVVVEGREGEDVGELVRSIANGREKWANLSGM